jgi:hypothetical protein
MMIRREFLKAAGCSPFLLAFPFKLSIADWCGHAWDPHWDGSVVFCGYRLPILKVPEEFFDRYFAEIAQTNLDKAIPYILMDNLPDPDSDVCAFTASVSLWQCNGGPEAYYREFSESYIEHGPLRDHQQFLMEHILDFEDPYLIWVLGRNLMSSFWGRPTHLTTKRCRFSPRQPGTKVYRILGERVQDGWVSGLHKRVCNS